MPTEAVEKPIDDTKPEEASGSGTESDSDEEVPDLEDGDLQQQSQVLHRICIPFYNYLRAHLFPLSLRCKLQCYYISVFEF